MKYCFLNNKIINQNKAQISIDDIGFLRGYSVFEVLRTFNSKIFLLDQHFERLEKSALLMNIKIPLSKKEVEKIIYNLISKNKQKEVNIRIIASGGKSINGFGFNPESATFCIFLEKINRLPQDYYEKGVNLRLIEHQRLFPEAKTTNYIFPIANRKLLKKSFFDFLYFSNNLILESSTSNFFLIKNNELITPKNNVLIGTTRNFVINFSKNLLQIKERDIKISEINNSDEAFLTAANKDILPVVKINGTKINNGKVGEKTKKLMNIFKEKTSCF